MELVLEIALAGVGLAVGAVAVVLERGRRRRRWLVEDRYHAQLPSVAAAKRHGLRPVDTQMVAEIGGRYPPPPDADAEPRSRSSLGVGWDEL